MNQIVLEQQLDGLTPQLPVQHLPVICSSYSIAGKHPPNQDFVFHGDFQIGEHVFCLGVLADGMGGCADGFEAARTAVETSVQATLKAFFSCVSTGAEALDLGPVLFEVIYAANEAVGEHPAQPEGGYFGTTLVIALVLGCYLHIVSIGDSRGWIYKDGRLYALTVDDSAVQDLVNQGLLNEHDALRHPRANVITRYIGQDEKLSSVVSQEPLNPGDVVLLTCDGVHKEGSAFVEATLRQLNAQHNAQQSLDDVTKNLCETALRHGADDNLSAVAMWFAPC